MLRTTIVMLLSFALFPTALLAGDQTPWGRAELTPTQYPPMKVVYDVTTGDQAELEHVLDRVSYLSTITGADPFEQSIVLVLHGSSIAFFAIRNFSKYENLQRRAQSLTVGGAIQIRMCKLAAEGQGFAPQDIHGFVEMVPMGDAEIVRLQYREGHAYMQ
jgi:intracellular sulfur oxidation DsrE/DsrF family protein